MIDQRDGSIRFDLPEVHIRSDMTLDQFTSLPMFHSCRTWVDNWPWMTFQATPIKVYGELFSAYFSFVWQRFSVLRLVSARPEFQFTSPDMVVATDRVMHCFHKTFLKTIIGRPPDWIEPHESDKPDADISYSFPWGSVSASTDSRTGASDISIGYAD